MRLHLIDGTYELYRAHFSPGPGRRAPDGRDVKATAGLVAQLLALLHDPDEAVTHLAVAFDNPIRSFRNDLFAGYKSDAGVPPALRAQFGAAEEATRAAGIVVWSMHEHEADDALATAARTFADDVEQVRILTPDKDLGQCLRGTRVVQVDRRRKVVTDEARFRAVRGFAPASLPDFLALVGDAADGIPGLPGFGERSTAALLGAYGHLEGIPSDPRRWSAWPRGADRLAATLAERKEDAVLYRTLATLVADVPLGESLDGLRHRGVPRGRFEAWCDAFGLERMRSVPRRWRAD